MTTIVKRKVYHIHGNSEIAHKQSDTYVDMRGHEPNDTIYIESVLRKRFKGKKLSFTHKGSEGLYTNFAPGWKPSPMPFYNTVTVDEFSFEPRRCEWCKKEYVPTDARNTKCKSCTDYSVEYGS